MRWRDHIALTLPSFLLRLVLALTFLWAGTAKIIGTTTTDGDDAARLANMGVTFIVPAPETEPDSDSNPDPDPDSDINSDLPTEPVNPLPGAVDDPPVQQSDPISEPDPETITDPLPETSTQPEPANPPVIRSVVQTTSPAVGSDYPDPVTFKRVYGLALMLDRAANPPLAAESTPVTPTLPSWLGSGRTPVYAAWAAAITELVCAVFLLLGLFTRFSALGLTVVMLVAMWITGIGPAVLQSSDAYLGFIPHKEDPWSPASYTVLLWQLALVIMSLSVALLGAGPLSIDRLLFRPGRRDPYLSGGASGPAPTPQPTHKHRPDPEPAPKDRTAFDRAPPPPNNPTP